MANADSQPYWAAARERRLVIRKCKACGELHFMPRYLCPVCWSDQLEWVDAKGTGSVHSFTIIRRASDPGVRAAGALRGRARSTSTKGPRMMANVVGDDALAVEIGDRVEVTFEDRGDGAMLPQFSRAAA